MSLTLAQADSYISRVLGGSNSTDILARAREALLAAGEQLSLKHNWAFLRQDTTQTFSVVSSATTTTMTTAVTNGFKDVLVGMTVTHANLAVGVTVSAKASNTSLTLSAAPSSAITTAAVTFGGTIPIISGTDTYTLPTKFWKPYSCRLVSSVKQPLFYIPQTYFDSLSFDQSIAGGVVAYTIYNANDFDASGTQQSKIKFFRVPSQNDVALLRYYRPFDGTKDPVDISDHYLYVLLDFARVHLLRSRNATDNRIPLLEAEIQNRISEAIAADRTEGGEDAEEQIRTPNEMLRGIGMDGGFWPRGDSVWGF